MTESYAGRAAEAAARSKANKIRKGTHPAIDMSKRKRALEIAIDTLELYADPESYRAIMVMADHPAGWFADDVGPEVDKIFKRKMHGREARKALAKIWKLIQ